MKTYTLDGDPIDLPEFLSDNCFGSEMLTAILALEPGDALVIGGGASPEFVLACVEGAK